MLTLLTSLTDVFKTEMNLRCEIKENQTIKKFPETLRTNNFRANHNLKMILALVSTISERERTEKK